VSGIGGIARPSALQRLDGDGRQQRMSTSAAFFNPIDGGR
jgi:hypothetical protein